MPTLDSTIDPRGDAFRANTEAMQALVSDLRAKTGEISLGGGEQARDFARRIYAALFIDGRNISEIDVVVDLATTAGANADETHAALGNQSIKDRLRQETDAAIERGVFGSPFFIVDGEPFWGNDRLGDVDKWLETGGW